MCDFKKYPTHRFEFYSRPDFKGVNVRCPKQFHSDEEAIEAAKKEITETNKKFGRKFYGSVQVTKYDKKRSYFDVIFSMNADGVIDDDPCRQKVF